MSCALTMKAVVTMFKKNFLIYILTAVVTLGAAFALCDEINPLKAVYMAVLSFLLCLAAGFDAKKISDGLRAVLSGILFYLTPVFLLAAVIDNVHIAMLRLWMMNYLLIFILLIFMLALSSRYSVSIIAVTVLLFMVFVLNAEVTIFRGMPIVPADIFAVNTALSVSDNYKPELTYEIFVSLQAALFWCILAAKLNYKLKGGVKGNILLGFLAVAFAVMFLCGAGSYFDSHNPDRLYYDKYDTALSNKKFGTLLTYYLNTKKMIIKKPLGYSAETAEEILSAVPVDNKGGDVRPNVVVIMDEAFSDLTGVYDIETDKEVLTTLSSLSENTVKGNMLVSVFGGNTCVTEFEFLTGLTAGNFDTETNAFTQSVTKPVNSLCYDFKSIGYTTVAIHPFWQNSWRRNKVYPLLGFDKCIFAENFGTGIEKSTGSMRSKPKFGDFEYIRGYLSDRECFKKIEEQFENKASDERLFVFNVTIQNHGGYTYSGSDFENEINVSGGENAELNQYLTLANKSDKAIGELIDYFKNYDEPAVVVVFGDHQPNVSFDREVREEYEYLGKNAKYAVPFIIWSNYDIEEKDINLTSPAYLSVLVKESCGLPENKWDGFRKELYGKYPALTLRSAYNSSYEPLDLSDIDDELYKKYKILQYGILFDKVKP